MDFLAGRETQNAGLPEARASSVLIKPCDVTRNGNRGAAFLEQFMTARKRHLVEIQLRIGDRIRCFPTSQPIVVGRDAECDLVVAFPWVSRQHAILEVRGNRLYLTDDSTNGTYLCINRRKPVLVHNQAAILPDDCRISLTLDPSDPHAEFLEIRAVVLP